MNICITGGCGFIGSHLIAELRKDHTIFIIDNLSTGKLSNIPNLSELTFINADLSDTKALKEIFAIYKFDSIVHLAAIASVQQCKEQPLYSNLVNNRATLELLNLATETGCEKFVFASSAAVYGDEPSLPKTEQSKVQPISIYGIDKFASEQYVMEYHRLGKINGTALRFFNVFGERQDPASPYSGVLSLFHKKINSEQNPVFTIFGDGLQTRDFIYVGDVVQAIKLSLFNKNFAGEVFNVATGNSISLLEIINLAEKISDKKITIDFKSARLGDIKFSSADISKINKAGFKINYSIEEALSKYFLGL